MREIKMMRLDCEYLNTLNSLHGNLIKENRIMRDRDESTRERNRIRTNIIIISTLIGLNIDESMWMGQNSKNIFRPFQYQIASRKAAELIGLFFI